MRAAFAVAALLPGLYWDAGLETAEAVKKAGIERLHVPGANAAAWRQAGFEAVAADPSNREKIPPPQVQYKYNVASATRAPWIDANGWRYLREPRGAFFLEPAPGGAALAAAEAFAYGADVLVAGKPADLDELGRMLAFLKGLGPAQGPVRANIGLIDDGSDLMGEVMVLLARRNLLFRPVRRPEPALDLNVRLGSADFPRKLAEDPHAFAQLLRQKLTDERRLVRIYGSEVVLAHLTAGRLHLINYGRRPVRGLRVRLLGRHKPALRAFGVANGELTDCEIETNATEFSIPELSIYAVVDLEKVPVE